LRQRLALSGVPRHALDADGAGLDADEGVGQRGHGQRRDGELGAEAGRRPRRVDPRQVVDREPRRGGGDVADQRRTHLPPVEAAAQRHPAAISHQLEPERLAHGRRGKGDGGQVDNLRERHDRPRRPQRQVTLGRIGRVAAQLEPQPVGGDLGPPDSQYGQPLLDPRGKEPLDGAGTRLAQPQAGEHGGGQQEQVEPAADHAVPSPFSALRVSMLAPLMAQARVQGNGLAPGPAPWQGSLVKQR
jgi:hypothetical protein